MPLGLVFESNPGPSAVCLPPLCPHFSVSNRHCFIKQRQKRCCEVEPLLYLHHHELALLLNWLITDFLYALYHVIFVASWRDRLHTRAVSFYFNTKKEKMQSFWAEVSVRKGAWYTLCLNTTQTYEYVAMELVFPFVWLSHDHGGIELNRPAARKCFRLAVWL